MDAMSRFELLSAFTLLAACSPTKDPRCNIDNCRKQADCRVAFNAEPSLWSCYRAGLQAPSNYDFSRDCPAACDAQEGGATLDCIANKPSCVGLNDEEKMNTVTSCMGSSPFSPPSSASSGQCTKTCDDERDKCDQACPTTDFNTCADCNRGCGLTWASCTKKCH